MQDIPQESIEQIGREIASDDSPVGIDAKKTHIIIIHMLTELHKRLERIEQHLGLDKE
jgi:hypothetical protein